MISIIEIGAITNPTADQARLKPYKRTSVFSKGIVTAWLIDVSSRSVWSNLPFGGILGERRLIERLLRESRLSEEALQPAPKIVSTYGGRPWLTFVMLGILMVVYACEFRFRIGSGQGLLAPDLRTLIAFGGLNRGMVFEEGQWYRIFTASLLHHDLIHLLSNGVALVLVGYVLERMVGHAWFLAIFLIGVIGGSLMSLMVNPSNIVSVGASGAILALFASAFVTSFHFPSSPARLKQQTTLLQVLILSLLPALSTNSGFKVDIGDHIGGAITGLLAGLALLWSWPNTRAHPLGQRLATALSVMGVFVFVASFFLIDARFHNYTLAFELIPPNQLPKTDAAGKFESEDLVSKYPHDPRAHLYRAFALMDTHNYAGAEMEFRSAQNSADAMQGLFKPSFRELIDTDIAKVIELEKHPNVTLPTEKLLSVPPIALPIQSSKSFEQPTSSIDKTKGLAPLDSHEITTVIKPSVEQGSAPAEYALGIKYLSGRGVNRDYTEAVKWLRKSAEQGYAHAQSNLGFMYSKGEGVPQDNAKAVMWFRKGADQGDALGQVDLGLSYLHGYGVSQDYTQAAKWIRKAAEQGSPYGEGNFGELYAKGEGVPQSFSDAARWYQKGADQGDAMSQVNLGLLYFHGQGMQRDYIQAMAWIRKGADQEDANGQVDLGLMYQNGDGAPRDYMEAAKWYRKAATRGNSEALLNLGVLYANGQGVQKDYLKAFALWSLCAPTDSEGSNSAAVNRKKLMKIMTPSQIQAGQSLTKKMQQLGVLKVLGSRLTNAGSSKIVTQGSPSSRANQPDPTH